MYVCVQERGHSHNVIVPIEPLTAIRFSWPAPWFPPSVSSTEDHSSVFCVLTFHLFLLPHLFPLTFFSFFPHLSLHIPTTFWSCPPSTLTSWSFSQPHRLCLYFISHNEVSCQNSFYEAESADFFLDGFLDLRGGGWGVFLLCIEWARGDPL